LVFCAGLAGGLPPAVPLCRVLVSRGVLWCASSALGLGAVPWCFVLVIIFYDDDNLSNFYRLVV